jgi:glutamyl-tRNA reductase
VEYGIIGTSIWQQNLPLLERLTIPREQKSEVLEKLRAELQLDELVYLSTCNRVEFLYAAYEKTDSDVILHRLIDFFFRAGRHINFFPNDFYHFTGREAIVHLFRTASALESLVVGETQITAQVKQAHQESVELGLCGPALECVVSEALAVAKKVRRETRLGRGSLSMASLAMREMQKHIVDSDSDRPVVALVGAGPMTTKFAKYVSESLDAKLLFVNRTVGKAEKLAERFGGGVMSLDEFLAEPGRTSAIISATASGDPIFGPEFLTQLQSGGREVVCVDLAIPRDFSSEFDSADAVTLLDIRHLKAREQGNLRQKFIEAGQANCIIRAAVTKFLSDQLEISLKPIFHESYRESLERANQALEHLFAHRVTSLTEEDRQAVSRLVSKLVGHSSFQPVRMLSEKLVSMHDDFGMADLVDSRREAV